MKLSIYTFVKDGLYYDFHVVDMIKHHLELADELVVYEGNSSDGTYEAISKIASDKLKIYRGDWDMSPKDWHLKFKDTARRFCTGDWCLLLDCDEFIPEWEFDKLRRWMESTSCVIGRMTFSHFYGNYRVRCTRPEKFIWPVYKDVIHRNLEDIEVWGDGSNVRRRRDIVQQDDSQHGHSQVDAHHFGFVRNPARLRQKWRIQHKLYQSAKPSWDRTPGLVYDVLPHRWEDPDFIDDLALYAGPYVSAVRANPSEFIRDDLKLCKVLESRSPLAGPAIVES